MRVLIIAAALATLATSAFAQTHDGKSKSWSYEAADVNGDGKLSPEELRAVEPVMGLSGARQLIAAADKDGDGLVTVAELTTPTHIEMPMGMPIMHEFGDADLDKDGGVTLRELHKESLPKSWAFIDLYFASADADNNGVLDMSEWAANRPTVTVNEVSSAD